MPRKIIHLRHNDYDYSVEAWTPIKIANVITENVNSFQSQEGKSSEVNDETTSRLIPSPQLSKQLYFNEPQIHGDRLLYLNRIFLPYLKG